MFQNEKLMDVMQQNPNNPTVFNMALIPRISRTCLATVLLSNFSVRFPFF